MIGTRPVQRRSLNLRNGFLSFRKAAARCDRSSGQAAVLGPWQLIEYALTQRGTQHASYRSIWQGLSFGRLIFGSRWCVAVSGGDNNTRKDKKPRNRYMSGEIVPFYEVCPDVGLEMRQITVRNHPRLPNDVYNLVDG